MTLPRSEAYLNYPNFPVNQTIFSNPVWNNGNQSSANSIYPDMSKRDREKCLNRLTYNYRHWNKAERAVLEKAYQENKFPDYQRQQLLALQLNDSEKRVSNWFRDRRKKEKKATTQLSSQDPNIMKHYQMISNQQPSNNSININPVYVYNNSNYWLPSQYISCQMCPSRYPLQNLMTSNFLRKEDSNYLNIFSTSIPSRYPMPNIDQQQVSLMNTSVVNKCQIKFDSTNLNEQKEDDILDLLDIIADSLE